MAVYKYKVDGEEYSIVSNGSSDWETGRGFIAEEIAEHYFNNCDGWEYAWPIDFEIDFGVYGVYKFSVGMERQPSFFVGSSEKVAR